MDEETRRASAKKELDQEPYRTRLVWICRRPDYHNDPRYELIVVEIADKARMPCYVLDDYERGI